MPPANRCISTASVWRRSWIDQRRSLCCKSLWTITALSGVGCGCCVWRTAGSCAPPRSMPTLSVGRKPAKLSQPALEVLTIIAYYQPTTRAYVDQIRGVDSSYTVGLLLDRHLIEECGRLQVPGRPRLYRTTKAFLRAFHLNSLEDLPEMPGMEADGQLRLAEDGSVLDDANA